MPAYRDEEVYPIMSLFGGIAASLAGSLFSRVLGGGGRDDDRDYRGSNQDLATGIGQAGIGLLGTQRGQDIADRYADLIRGASAPFSVSGPLGNASFDAESQTLALQPGVGVGIGGDGGVSRMLAHTQGANQYLSNIAETLRRPALLRALQPLDAEVNRLREQARPKENQLRAQVRSSLLNQGRLGLGAGGTRTGLFANPELAALEEGLANADLNRFDLARQNRDSDIGTVMSLLGLDANILQSMLSGSMAGQELDLANQQLSLANRQLTGNQALQSAQLGIQARTPASGLQGLFAAGQRAGNANDAFFTSLGSQVPNIVGGLFNGQSGAGNSVLERSVLATGPHTAATDGLFL